MPETEKAGDGRRRGRFLTFEGGEGAGKSTQVARLADRLRQYGVTVVTTREPGGSPGAEALRHVLLSGAAETLGPDAEAILFAAARADHVDRLIRPAVAAGQWVICDRFIDSTRVYQGVTGAVPPRLIAALEAVSVGEILPDLTLLLDIPAAEGLGRASARRGMLTADRFEKDGIDLHERRRDGFLALARAEPNRFAVIDAAQDVETVAEAVWYAVRKRLRV
ncbi:MAG: dTMP kinase [Ancalomicrobiaceae bacterium]|nr:dTMP kinase [Ancalomicrobiaceae bacterium]